MSQEQVTTENKATQRCYDWMEHHDQGYPSVKIWSVIPYLLMKHPDAAIRAKIDSYLQKWTAEVCTGDGVKDIVDCLDADEVSMLMDLITAGKESNSKPRDIVEYFENLSVREKLLINAASEIGCLSSSIPSAGDNLDSRIQDAITVDPADVPNDPECQWLLGIQQLASTASR